MNMDVNFFKNHYKDIVQEEKVEKKYEMKCYNIYLNSDGYVCYFCLLCNKRLSNTVDHIAHLQSHFKGPNVSCDICSIIFDELNMFVKHNHYMHQNNKKEENKENINNIKREVNEKDNEMTCYYCNSVFVNSHDRLQHLVFNHLITNSTSKKSIASDNNEKHYDLHCDIVTENSTDDDDVLSASKNNIRNTKSVTKEYKNSSTTNHADSKNNKLAFQCNICDVQFNDNNEFRNHIIDHKNGILSNFVYKVKNIIKNKDNVPVNACMCDICGKQFASRRNMILHMVVHNRERNHKCPICNKGFSQSSYIKPHMRIHTDEKPYKCAICLRTFRVSGHLTSHMLRHYNIRRHSCTFCVKKFFDLDQLRAHIRTHTGDKPFQCDVCDTYFRTKYCMQSHRRLHTGETPFNCTKCGKRFAQMAGLYGHLKMHALNDSD